MEEEMHEIIRLLENIKQILMEIKFELRLLK